MYFLRNILGGSDGLLSVLQGGVILKYIACNKKTAVITLLLIAFISIVLMVFAQSDFLKKLVLNQLRNTVDREFNVKLEISPLSGNPITGFKASSIALVRSGDNLLTADTVEINLSLLSLLKNSPRIGTLIVTGLRSDYDSLNLLMPKRKDKTLSKNVPIDKIKFDDAEVSSKWGLLELDDSLLQIRGTEWFAPSLRGIFAGTPFAVSGICKKLDGNWELDGFSITLDEGITKISGKIFPTMDFRADMKELNLDTVAKLFPNFAKYGVYGILTGTSDISGGGQNIAIVGKGKFKNALLRGIPLSEVDAEWKYDKGILDLGINESKIFNSSLSGKMKLDMQSDEKYFELKASASNLRFADWTDSIRKGIPKNVPLLQGEISNLTADLKGPLNALVGKIEMTPSNVSYNKIELSALQGRVVFDGKPDGVVAFSALHGGGKVIMDGTFSFAEGVPTNLKLNATSIKIDAFGNELKPLKKYNLRGTANFSATLKGLLGGLLLQAKITSSSIEMDKIGAISNLEAEPEYNFKDGTFSLNNLSGLLNGSPVNGSGRTNKNDTGTILSFGGTFKNVSAEKLYDAIPFLQKMNISANASGTWRIDGTKESPRVLLNIKASNGRFRNLKVDNFSTDLSCISGFLSFDSMNAEAVGGTGALKGKVILAKKTPDNVVTKKATWEVSGKIKDVDVSVLNGLFRFNQDIDGPCTGDFNIANNGNGMEWSSNLSGAKIRWKQFRADEAMGIITGDTKEIRFEGIKVGFLGGDHNVKGTIRLAGEGKPAADAILDLTVVSKKVGIYELLRRHLSVIRSIQGLIESNIKVGGRLGSPSYKGTGKLEPFRYRGFLLPILDVKFYGNLAEIYISEAKAKMQAGEVLGKGKIYLKEKQWYAELDTNGSNIDMRQFGAYLPDNFRQKLGGIANFEFAGNGKVDDFKGKGSFSSKKMRFLGIILDNVNAPFYIADGYALMEDVKAGTNGGTLSGGLAMDLNKSIWGGNLTVLSADVKPMLKQAFPDLKGTLSGKGDLKVRAGGETGRMSTVRSGGVLLLHDGEIAKFDAVEAARKYTKGKPLLYKKLQVAFTSDGSYLTILPGSQALAPPGDTLYRYVMIDGLVDKEKNISMFAMGKVSIRALNALLGALQGIINVGMDFSGGSDKNVLLQNFLGGVLSGLTGNDLRFVTLNINGNLMSPTFSNIKVSKVQQISQGKDVIPKSASDPSEKGYSTGNRVFELKFEIPVGPGVGDETSNVEEQVLEQTLENLLHGINFGE